MDGDAYRATTYGPGHGLPPFALALGVGGGSLTISNTCRPERRDDVQRQDAPVTHQNGPGERESSGIQLGLPPLSIPARLVTRHADANQSERTNSIALRMAKTVSFHQPRPMRR